MKLLLTNMGWDWAIVQWFLGVDSWTSFFKCWTSFLMLSYSFEISLAYLCHLYWSILVNYMFCVCCVELFVPHFACNCICIDRYGYHVTKGTYFICHDQGNVKKLFENLRNYDGKNNYPKTCGRFEISGIRDLTTGYDDSQPDKKAVSNAFTN